MGNAFDQFDGKANPFDEFDHPKPPPEVMPISKEAGYALDPSGAPAPEPPAPLPRQAGADGKPYQPGWEWMLPGASKDFIPEGPVRVPGQGGFGAAKNAFLGSLEQGMGELVAAPPRIAQGFASGPRRFQNSQIAAMDAIDAGKDVPQDQDAAGYQFMSPEQRAETRASIGKAEPGPIEQGFGKTADEISRSVNADSARGFPVDPEQSKKFAVKLAGMAGGMAPLVVATAIGGLPGAVGVAFGQSYTSTFEDAKAHGADDDAAHGAALGNAAVQSGLMAVPAAQWLGHLAPEFGNAILSASIGTAIHGGTMVGVSQVQALANNLVAQGYDPNRKMGDGLGDDMLEQFALGALIPAAGHAAGAAGRGIARGFDALRQPVADPRLIANVEAQRAAMTTRVQGLDTPDAAPPSVPPPTAPLRPEAQQAPAPIVTPPGPHEVLENIATGKDPATPKVTPAPPSPENATSAPNPMTPPPPSPPGRPAGVDQLPPATFDSPPPSPPAVRSTSQIQRDEGIGYNQAVKVQAAEKAAVDARDAHDARINQIADGFESLGDTQMAGAIRAGAKVGGQDADFLQSKLDAAKVQADPNANVPKPAETFTLQEFMATKGPAAAKANADAPPPPAEPDDDQFARRKKGVAESTVPREDARHENVSEVPGSEGSTGPELLPGMSRDGTARVAGDPSEQPKLGEQAEGPGSQNLHELREASGETEAEPLSGLPRGRRTRATRSEEGPGQNSGARAGESGVSDGAQEGQEGIARRSPDGSLDQDAVRGVRGSGRDASSGLRRPAGRDVGMQGASRADHAGGTSASALEAIERLRTAAEGMFSFMGLPKGGGLKLVDKIVDAAGNAADAKYARGVITFALDTDADKAPFKMWHEGAHFLLDPQFGLLNQAERKALLTGADRWLNDGRKGVERRAKLKGEGYSPAEMREEAVGRMAEEALARGIQPRSALAGAIDKLQNVGRGLGQALRGQGFKTADDVFNGLMRGEKAAPGALEGATAAIVPSRTPPPPPPTRNPQADEPTKIEPNKSITVPDVPAEDQAAMRAKLDEAFAPEGDQKAMQDVIGDRSQEQFARRAQDRTMMETAHEAADGIKLLFSPTSRGVGAKDQELLIRGRTAMKAQSAAITAHALEKFRHVVGRLTPDEQIDLTDRMETGLPQPTPQLQEVADAIRGQLDRWTARIQSLGTGKLEDANEFYMGRAYSNYDDWAANRQPTNAQAQQIAALRGAVGAGISKRPITGSGNFLKARSFEYLKDAIQAGLIPVTTNPIEMQTLKLREMQQYYHGAKLAEEMKATGLARWVPVEGYRTAEALGMKELDDKVFKPKVPADAVGAGHGLIEHGKWMGPGTAADVFNNYVSTGFGGNVIYDAARRLNNGINTLQLGLSGFHATFIAKDAMTSRVALGLSQVMRGDLGRGIVNTALGFSPHTIATTIAKGSQLRSAYLDPQNATPEWRKLAAALNAGGGRIGMDQFYRASDAGSFFHNLRDVANPDGAFREAAAMVKNTPLTSPFRIAARVLDTITHPLMGEMVPRAKLGVFADLAADWQRRNPTATPEQTAQAMTKFWDSVDNRMGQLVYDNLFWRKAMKDIAFVMTRSVGWNLGTIRELGGSVVDAGRAANALAHGRSPELTTRMAYAMAMPLVTMLYGGLLTYAYTGKAPEEIKDYFYPATGKVVNGIKQRLMLPGYEKDVLAYSNDPLQTLANKTGPAINMALEIGKNRDFYGGVIYDKARDNPLIAYPEYLMNQAIPFTGRAMMKNAARPGGASMMDQALAFWGIQPAGASITNPERGAKFQAQQAVRAYKRRATEQDRIRITGE